MTPLSDSDIGHFAPVFLEEMQGASLQNRLDFKFVFNRALLLDVLNRLKDQYRVLEINGIRLQHYDTIYFDTPDHALYHAHHNQRGNRMKVRIRNYTSNNLCFAEVKSKLNTGRTVKKRYPVNDIQSALPEEISKHFLQSSGLKCNDLVTGVKIGFDRLTLVSAGDTERLTLDLNLKMQDEQNVESVPELVIAELKLYQKIPSTFKNLMQEMRIPAWGISKYCLAVSLLKKGIRRNNFKPIHNYLYKIQNLNGARPV